MPQEPDLQELIKRIENVEHQLGIFYSKTHDDELLEGILESLDGRTIQQIFREVDAKDLALAIAGFQAKALGIVKDNLSKKGWEMLKDDMAYHSNWNVYGNSKKIARLKILNVIKQLEEMGEIASLKNADSKLEKKDSFDFKDWLKKLEDERIERVKIFEAWKKEVFDPIDK